MGVQDFLPLRTHCQSCETQITWKDQNEELRHLLHSPSWAPKQCNTSCHHRSRLSRQLQPTKPPDICSPKWRFIKQKNCTAKSSQPTETWDNKIVIALSLNFVVPSYAAIHNLNTWVFCSCIYLSPKASIMLNGERLKIFLLKSKLRQGLPYYHY